MAARRLTAKERRELPARAFGIPSSRKYPVMVLSRSGEAVPSKSHAVDAKGRAKEELEKGRIDSRQYNQIVRKADAAIREIDRGRKKAKRNPPKKKAAKRKATKRKVTKKKATRKRRKNPGDGVYMISAGMARDSHPGLWRMYRVRVDPDVVTPEDVLLEYWNQTAPNAKWFIIQSQLMGSEPGPILARLEHDGSGGAEIVSAFHPGVEQLLEEQFPANNPKKKATRKRRKNPTEAQHEAVGIEALKNSEEYWRGYMADKSKTNLLVDAYKFLVIAHEELKYSGNSEPRLQADHMLKAAHKELSKMLK